MPPAAESLNSRARDLWPWWPLIPNLVPALRDGMQGTSAKGLVRIRLPVFRDVGLLESLAIIFSYG